MCTQANAHMHAMLTHGCVHTHSTLDTHTVCHKHDTHMDWHTDGLAGISTLRALGWAPQDLRSPFTDTMDCVLTSPCWSPDRRQRFLMNV